MKKQHFLPVFALILSVLLQACSGSQGPIGPQGPQGQPGDSYIGQAFDVSGVNFNNGNQFRYGIRFADAQVEVLESDVVLVYIHWNDQTVDDQTLAAWRLLPQTELMETGTLIYNFDRTAVDFSIFLSSNFNLATLGSDYTQNQVFRVVVIPADFLGGRTSSVDFSDYEAVAKAYAIEEKNITTLSEL